MPLIPGVNQRSVNPNAAATPYFKIDTSADDFGNGIGKSLLGFVKPVGDAVNTAAKFLPKTQAPDAEVGSVTDSGDDKDHVQNTDKQGFGGVNLAMPPFNPDLSHAIDLTNTFNAGAQDLRNGFLQLSGKDAVDGLADAQQGVDQLRNDVLATAKTPDAADRAQPAIDLWTDALKGSLQRHATAQQQVYDDDLDSTQVAQGRQAVGLLYNDTPHFLMQLHVGTQASADQAVRTLLSDNPQAGPEAVAAASSAAQQMTASDFTRARIEGALDQGDVAGAQALHDRWGGDLLPGDQDPVTQHLQLAQSNQQVQQQTARIMAINQPMPAEAPLGTQRNAYMMSHHDEASGTQTNGPDVTNGGNTPNKAPESDEPSVKAQESPSKLDGTVNHAEFGKGRSKIPANLNEPPTFVFHLNGQSMSALQGENGQSFAAFSGNGSATNDPAKTSAENSGPLPEGTYYIVARQSGGRLGALDDRIYKIISGGVDRNEWFSLYRADGTPDDSTSIDGVTRGAFRLHPIGPKGLSEGCITISNKADFDKIRQQLIMGKTRLIPGTNTPYYGTVLVQ